MKILVTGFNPFGGEKINPAIETVKRLPDQIAGTKIIKLEVPTEFNRCAAVVKQAIIKQRPQVVLCVGQAGGRAAITPERVAININEGSIPDNAGYQPHGEPIQLAGPAAYFTQLPIEAEVAAIQAAGLPAQISNSAGTYVCNHLFYQVEYLREQEFPSLQAGFIHIPYLPEQVVNKPSQPSMALTDCVTGLTAAITAIISSTKN
ncbi:MAG: pyroglutamyl-peptidase I [Lactobacillus sp.]|jgi:pyroglutamyl-peptidase|nr:pyroglutamyl-peptidase I [Lactobacillus sp.]MCH3905692.1 pyroglutamyl-peptidase I [Lactobacillus sp.]MCH3990739.1 pyroglutamyl-peptidase I [Lactobacillus sp.]MCH4068545.1 pyroglutamyl-peptidase I [Lactobacillus sp.]MCI1304160.1 pyroglutamyl-peptidase I [Lactobacillus sp.]